MKILQWWRDPVCKSITQWRIALPVACGRFLIIDSQPFAAPLVIGCTAGVLFIYEHDDKPAACGVRCRSLGMVCQLVVGIIEDY